MNRRLRIRFDQRGAVLIVVLGVLVVLALLATTFAILQANERSVSKNYVDGVRARLIAQSGIEDGTQRIELSLRIDLPGLVREVNRDPSFAWELDENPANANAALRKIKVQGKDTPLTGTMSHGRYGAHGDFYSIRVRDLQGCLHVNEGLGEPGWTDANGDGKIDANDSSVSQNLRRILNRLGAVPSVGVPGLGDQVVAARPAGGYRAVGELEKILGSASYGKVEAFLTTHAWVDRSVANPVPLGASVLSDYPVQYYRGDGVHRFGRNADHKGSWVTTPLAYWPLGSDGVQNAVFGMDELNPQYIQVVERAPVNVNTARREVLIALLDGLCGFFLVERRADNLPGWTTVYDWMSRFTTFRPSGADPGAVGYLYRTIPIVGAGSGTMTTGISAEAIAEHLLACREKRSTAGVSAPFDYSAASWGGPFSSWRQFYRFCDNLVEIGLLVDDRAIFKDAGSPSAIQKKRASQAIADVLKANFNPNLTLNETNPNANLFTWVDKTDLIVHSTEFCFLPMGRFAIDSVGRVVRPLDTDDAFTASDNALVAESRMSAVVMLYDVVRQTTQSEFQAGTLAPRTHLPLTSNNKSLEIGPEPDQGNAPGDNGWGGFITLPTVGGLGVDHAKGTTALTPAGTSELGDVLHGHFSGDFRLHYHADGVREDLASGTLSGESVSNLPDRMETQPGPYSPEMGGGNLYRMARTMRLLPGQSFPSMSYRAPLDLRVDGAYSERHSAPAYWLSPSILGPNTGSMQGVMSFWVKPSFFPEMSGKARLWLSMDRQYSATATYMNPSPFLLLYSATHDAPAYQVSTAESGTPFYNLGSPFGPQGMRPMSLGWGYGYSSTSGHGGSIAEGGVNTPTLNHVGHSHSAKPSHLLAHEWMHVVVTWRTQDAGECKVFVNGQYLTGTTGVWYYSYKPNSIVDWSKHFDGSRNSLRLGAVSRFRGASWGYNRNWPADATIDELYMWNSTGALNAALGQWQEGRYYKVQSTQEGHFTSALIDAGAGSRALPSASSTATPPLSTGTMTTSTPAPASDSAEIVGVSWTWYGEGTDADGQEILIDRATGEAVHPQVKVSILAGALTSDSAGAAGFSRITAPGNQPFVFSGPFRYRVQFSLPDAQFGTILHTAPVFDDITIFYRRGPAEYLSWICR